MERTFAWLWPLVGQVLISPVIGQLGIGFEPRVERPDAFNSISFVFEPYRVPGQQAVEKGLADGLARLAVTPRRGVERLIESFFINLA